MANGRFKLSKKYSIIFGSIIVIILLFSTSILINITDGSEYYSGVEKQIALKALDHANKGNASAPIPIFLKARVEQVRAIQHDELATYCLDKARISTNPSETGYYAVVVSYRTFFGLQTKAITYYGCSAYNEL